MKYPFEYHCVNCGADTASVERRPLPAYCPTCCTKMVVPADWVAHESHDDIETLVGSQ